jgi:hypothetical protein
MTSLSLESVGTGRRGLQGVIRDASKKVTEAMKFFAEKGVGENFFCGTPH